MLVATFLGRNPGTSDQGWIVANVLTVATGEIGDPVAFFVLMKSNNPLIHG